jgi:hypothetical protein
MEPTIGRIVIYTPTEMQQNRMRSLPDCNVATKLPAIITAVWNPTCVNLKVFYDGEYETWVTSSIRGDLEGMWDFPVIVKS